MTSYSLCILSNSAASGEIKFGFISRIEPSDKFQTFISLFVATISRISFKIVKELNPLAVATPKCRTLNLPHPSSKSGLKDGPSTIIELTAVP